MRYRAAVSEQGIIEVEPIEPVVLQCSPTLRELLDQICREAGTAQEPSDD